MKKFKNIIIIVIVLIIMFLIVGAFLRKPNLMPVKGQLQKINLSGVDKLMIVSHPGDESVWGGAHLLSDNYLVVCISCGFDKDKTSIFQKNLQISKDYGIMMGYSDKFYFSNDYKKIKKQIKYILKYKNWKEVVTHNPDGEYDNYQHKQINKILNDLSATNLHYFGKYYSERELDKLDKETTLDRKLIQQKINMVKKYADVYNDYKHMLPFEDWIGADKWKS